MEIREIQATGNLPEGTLSSRATVPTAAEKRLEGPARPPDFQEPEMLHCPPGPDDSPGFGGYPLIPPPWKR